MLPGVLLIDPTRPRPGRRAGARRREQLLKHCALGVAAVASGSGSEALPCAGRALSPAACHELTQRAQRPPGRRAAAARRGGCRAAAAGRRSARAAASGAEGYARCGLAVCSCPGRACTWHDGGRWPRRGDGAPGQRLLRRQHGRRCARSLIKRALGSAPAACPACRRRRCSRRLRSLCARRRSSGRAGGLARRQRGRQRCRQLRGLLRRAPGPQAGRLPGRLVRLRGRRLARRGCAGRPRACAPAAAALARGRPGARGGRGSRPRLPAVAGRRSAPARSIPVSVRNGGSAPIAVCSGRCG